MNIHLKNEGQENKTGPVRKREGIGRRGEGEWKG
jgi:hypothetical protein